MTTTRRGFLKRVMAGAPFAFGTLTPSGTLASNAKPLMLLLDGISPSTPAPLLFSFIDPIVSQVVPVGCLVRTEDSSGKRLEENRELCELFARLHTDYRGLVEIVLTVSDLADPRGFFAMRRASDVQTDFRRCIAPFRGSDEPPFKLLSVATEVTASIPPLIEGVRSAGFRSSVLLQTEAAETVAWKTKEGTQQIFGGRRISIGSSKQDIANTILGGVADQDLVVVVAPFPDDFSSGEDGFFQAGANLGDAFASVASPGQFFMTLPTELRLRSGEAPERRLVLLVDATNPSETFKDFLALLRKAGLPFTEIRNVPDATADASLADVNNTDETPPSICWLASSPNSEEAETALPASVASPSPSSPAGATSSVACIALDGQENPLPVKLAGGLDVILDLSPENTSRIGLDTDGVLRIPVDHIHEGNPPIRRSEDLKADLGQNLAEAEDIVLLIRSSSIAAPADGEALVNALSGLVATPGMKAMNLDQHARMLTDGDEPLRLTKIARRFPARPTSQTQDKAESELLLEDAKLAWSFFDQLSDPKTGLVSATAWTEGETVERYNFATMWDIGSQILATISARSIGLIDQSDFDERTQKILGHLADGSFENLRLPKGVTSTTGTEGGKDAYNASDTARLLIALKVLDGFTDGGFAVPDIVSRWDLAETFKDGVPQTVQGSRMTSAFRSNYAGYISRAFGLWGFETAAPYKLALTGSGVDVDVEILHEVADLGPIGTEPHLLEAVELGFSPLARASAEALFAAQLSEHQATGKLVCVSEVPIDREPWFVYQGYQIGDEQAHWTFETLSTSPRFKTRGFQRAVDQVSSKAAFLWQVTRPGEYTDLVLEHVRRNAKGFSLGFAPGVFSSSGRAEQNYSDANTNGVILQAIAYRLNGGKPALEWRQAK